jgi:hypothetical protein
MLLGTKELRIVAASLLFGRALRRFKKINFPQTHQLAYLNWKCLCLFATCANLIKTYSGRMYRLLENTVSKHTGPEQRTVFGKKMQNYKTQF